MKRPRGSFFLVLALIAFPLLRAADGSPTALEGATVSEIKNQVVYQAADGTERTAKAEEVVQGQEVIKTGSGSGVELDFPDGTLARLGSVSALTFAADAREVQLRNGLGVFFVPKNTGGLRVAAQAVAGTVESGTVVVEEIDRRQGTATQHWTKFLLIEGAGARVWGADGKHSVGLHGGQGVFQRAGVPVLSRPFDFDVKALTENATIFTGFHRTWPGLENFSPVIERQSRELKEGKLVHASVYWKGRGTQQGTIPPQYPAPELPGMQTPPYIDSGVMGGLLYHEFNDIGTPQPTPSGIK
jgi:hypothetical protein